MDSEAHSMSFDFPVSVAVTNAFPAFNQWARLKNPEGKSAISACWASRSLTIFRNGPLFGAMTNVKRVSQSAIVNARWTRSAHISPRCEQQPSVRTIVHSNSPAAEGTAGALRVGARLIRREATAVNGAA